MSVIQEPGSTRPGRAAGLLLIGVAVIAVVLGVITLIDGGEENKPNGSAPPSSNTGQPPPSNQPNPGQPPASNQPPPAQSSQPPPVTTTTVVAQPPAPDPKQVPLRVFNNSTIARFAAQAAEDFRKEGWNVVEVGNYSEKIIPTTTAYFRPGTEEEAAARALATRFNMKAEPRLPSFAYSPGVIVMITKDYGSK